MILLHVISLYKKHINEFNTFLKNTISFTHARSLTFNFIGRGYLNLKHTTKASLTYISGPY